MNIKWDEMSERSQTAAALAIVGMISLGLCGAQFAGLPVGVLARLGALGILISVVGLVCLGLYWLLEFIVGLFTGHPEIEPEEKAMASRSKHPSVSAKLATSSAVLGAVSFGICGIKFAFPDRRSEFGWTWFGVIGFLGLVLSVFGLVVVGAVSVVKLVIDKASGGDQPIRLHDPPDSSLPINEVEPDEDKP